MQNSKRLLFSFLLLGAALAAGLILPHLWRGQNAAYASEAGFISNFLETIDRNSSLEIKTASLLNETGIASALKQGRLRSLRFYDAPAMRAFYEARGYEPLWLNGATRVKSDVDDVIKLMQESWKHGLNPENYHINELWQLYKSEPQMTRYELELVLSDAVIRYGRDLTGMRIDPGQIKQKSKYWQQPARGIDILHYIAKTGNGVRALKKLEPQGELYKALQKELEQLVRTPDKKDLQKVSLSGGILRPGNSHRAIKDVRLRLGLDPAKAVQGEYTYDDALFEAVQKFQSHHGLPADGIIGPQTVQIMNMTREDKIYQVIANLERMRWVEQTKPEKYVLVNIPSARLWAVENGRTKLEMSVIVGSKKRETTSFKTEITGIRLNPNWTVPPTIKREDYLPKLQEDPHYLTKRGIEMVSGYGSNARTVDPESIDWSGISWQEMNGIRMIQAPGRTNPLGRVRIIMPNPYNIYLHDTNNKTLFNRANRTLSSGCIRMAEPEKLVMFLMEGQKNWDEQKMNDIFSSGRLQEVTISNPVPVYILYQTVWLDESGDVVFGPDVYGRDRDLIQILKSKDFIHIPAAESI